MTSPLHRVLQALFVVGTLGFAFLAALMIAGMRTAPEQHLPPVVIPLVETVTVTLENVELRVQAQGIVIPHTQSMILSEVAGSVLEVADSLRAGSLVQEGEVLARIDDNDYALALAEAHAALAQARLKLEQALADAANSKRDWERSGVSAAPSALVLREPQVADARAQLGLAEARQRKAQADLERCVVRAPFTARVRSTMIDRGQFVARGAQIATLIRTDVLEARIPIPDADLAYLDLELGGNINAANAPEARLSTVFGGKEHSWSARIVRTEAELDPASRMVVIIARIENTRSAEGGVPLAVGMFVEVDIRGRHLANKVKLPREALRGEARVMTVDSEDHLRFRTVEVHRQTPDSLIIDAGLEPGDRVIISPLEAPVDGMTVRQAELSE